jgi:biopolymer transport protein ExbD
VDFPRTRARRTAREPVVPLINIVFLLLLFFMLAGRLRAPEHFDIEIPASHAQASAAPPLGATPVDAPPAVVVQLAADGRLALDGRPIALSPLVSELAARGSAGGGRAGAVGVKVELRADARTRARHLLPLLAGLRDAGAGDIELVTLETL